jgi:hypothetical protein
MPGSKYKDLRDDARFADLQADFGEAAEDLFRKFLMPDGLDSMAAINEVLGRFKAVIRSASGPAFDDDGFIPPIQVCSAAEVARWFGFSGQREKLLARVRKWISLAKAVKAGRLLLDGSFVTAKDEPGDVDAVLLLPDDFRDQLRAGNPAAAELHEILKSFARATRRSSSLRKTRRTGGDGLVSSAGRGKQMAGSRV